MKLTKRNEHFPHILLFYFRQGKSASQSHKEFYALYDDKEQQCQNWFLKFRSGDFLLKDEQRSGRPVEDDDAQIKSIIESHGTTREIADKLDVHISNMHRKCKYLFYFLFIKKLPDITNILNSNISTNALACLRETSLLLILQRKNVSLRKIIITQM